MAWGNYYGPGARAQGDSERRKGQERREQQRAKKAREWLASPAGQKSLAAKVRKAERDLRCRVCRGVYSPENERIGLAGCCSVPCYEVFVRHDAERAQARRLGIPVAVLRTRLALQGS